MVARHPVVPSLASRVTDARIRARRSLEGALAVGPQPPLVEQRLSAVYIGLVDLHRRLGSAERMRLLVACVDLERQVADLQRRTWLAAALLDAWVGLCTVDDAAADADARRSDWERLVAALEASSGTSLFA